MTAGLGDFLVKCFAFLVGVIVITLSADFLLERESLRQSATCSQDFEP